MRELERQGAIDRVNGSTSIDIPLDYKRNDGAEFQTTDLEPVSTSKTEVLTTATYAVAQLQVPITWSKKNEAENPSANQKISLVKSLIENALTTHDDLIEEALFVADTNGFKGLPTIIPTNGQGTVGGIDSGTETWFRNYATTYLANYSDIEAKMTVAYNTASKGSGSAVQPKFLVSDAETHAGFEGQLQGLQRFVDTSEANAGFKVLAFKTARYVFSQYGTTSIFFLNAKTFKLKVFKNAYRLLGDTKELINAAGYTRQIFSLLQTTTNNKSRLAVISPA